MCKTRYIIAGRFIDGSGADVQKNVYLGVHDSVITSIGPASELPLDEEAIIEDFSHCTILPSFVDCSVSLSHSPSLDKNIRSSAEEADLTKKASLIEQHINYCHVHGVLGVALSDDIKEIIKGHMNGTEENSIITIRTSGNLSSTDSDFLKILYSGNIEDENTPNPHLNHDDLCRILKEKGEKKAVVVANGVQDVHDALVAGCDAIEQGYQMGEENLRKMAEKDVLWIPSVLRAKNALDGSSSSGDVCCRFSLRYVAPGKPVPGAEAFWKKTLADQLEQLRLARKLGVKTAIGTGAGSTGILHGESMVEEMKLFIKGGYSLEETIMCASKNGAEFFRMNKLGALTVGSEATFLVTRGSVKQLPRKLSYLEGIYVDGLPSPVYRKHPVKTGVKTQK